MEKPTPKLLGLARWVALAFFGAIALYLAVISLVQTSLIVGVETSEYRWDNPLIHLLFLAAILTVAGLLWPLLERLNSRGLLLVLMAVALLAGNACIFLARIQPGADQADMIALQGAT